MTDERKQAIRKKWKWVKGHPWMYLMLIPGLFFVFVYKFWPLYGLAMAFEDYDIFAGSNPMDAISKSTFVGLKWFRQLFASAQFKTVFCNTLEINLMKILFLFWIPILCAIMINEIRIQAWKKTVTTAIYIPYFFSWVVIYGVFYSILGSYGLINQWIISLGGKRIMFFSDPHVFRGVLIFTEGWKEIGYNTIIYLAAMTSIDPCLYEAARIDGASKLSQIWHVTLPGILPTIVLMLILKVGYILDTGFEQVLIFYNPAVYDVADIIQTYVYRIGLGQANFSLATALGLFNSVIAFVLIVGANTVSKKALGRSIW